MTTSPSFEPFHQEMESLDTILGDILEPGVERFFDNPLPLPPPPESLLERKMDLLLQSNKSMSERIDRLMAVMSRIDRTLDDSTCFKPEAPLPLNTKRKAPEEPLVTVLPFKKRRAPKNKKNT